ncbi:hypothetical protein [Mucilaginibacter agri]|uniref:Uncharacterized protein n=1 Tax=Mucilaginibacter agri TaxID=2695265 RepID=A0A965ZKP1_9SPHI|nr:hypothetical protein [Mucilaginibacter agri]NCD71847.1 hypothetical protein [Mucilaginibacter agri]
MSRLEKLSSIYLYLVPPMVFAVGFGIGHVSYIFYLPIWILNASLMLFAVRQLALAKSNISQSEKEEWILTALLLIIPWLLFSVFAGMGRPPGTIKGWVATATEQQIRYTILIIGGISALLGFALLKAKLQILGEHTYSVLGFATIGIAIPLFILNMAFWGYYLPVAFSEFVNLPAGKRPDWYSPVEMLFYVIAIVEVALIYLTTILFPVALKKAGLLNTAGSRWYIILSAMGVLFVSFPPSWPAPFSIVGFLAAIPAIPFIMPYLIGVRLLRMLRTRD